MTDEEKLQLIKDNPMNIGKVDSPTIAMKRLAVTLDGMTLRLIKKPSIGVQLKAIKQNPHAIEFATVKEGIVIDNAVRQHPELIMFINHPSANLQLLAVSSNSQSIEFINEPLMTIQRRAVRDDGRNIEFIKNPDVTIQYDAIQENPQAIEYIDNPDKSAFEFAVRLGYKSKLKDDNKKTGQD